MTCLKPILSTLSNPGFIRNHIDKMKKQQLTVCRPIDPQSHYNDQECATQNLIWVIKSCEKIQVCECLKCISCICKNYAAALEKHFQSKQEGMFQKFTSFLVDKQKENAPACYLPVSI